MKSILKTVLIACLTGTLTAAEAAMLEAVPERPASPAIHHDAWGRVEVAGEPRPFKDVKLYPGGAREWDWGETGTRHRPVPLPIRWYEMTARTVWNL